MRQEVYVKFAEALARQVAESRKPEAVKQAEQDARVAGFLRSVGVVPASVKQAEQDARVDAFLRSVGFRRAE